MFMQWVERFEKRMRCDMDIQVGDYIRTKKGVIGKVGEIVEFKRATYNNRYFSREVRYFGKVRIIHNELIAIQKDILKHSNNIIDLIEIGDYVNGLKITSILNHNGKNKMVYAEDGDFYLLKSFKNNQIRSIVTKEQFESIEYKVGD